MGESKHTPGPWSVAPFDELDKRIAIVASGIEHAPLAWVDNDDVAPGEGEANATLAAAAPQMLEALRRLADSIATCVPCAGSGIQRTKGVKPCRPCRGTGRGASADTVDALVEARAAIKAATGGET